MNVKPVARPFSLRAVPPATWLLIVLAGLSFASGVLPPRFSPLGALAGAGPILFAAAVFYVAPSDRRFRWAALALAAPPVVRLLADSIPTIWQQVAPGDWVNAVALLQDLGGAANDVAILVGLIALFPLSFALGGVRAFLSWVILAAGVAVALVTLTWYFAHPVEQLPLIQQAKSVAYPTLSALGWAFVFAAALESLRSLTLIGAGLVATNVLVRAVLLWLTLGPDANLDLLSLVIVVPLLAGWLAMTAGALRGELSGSPARGRVRGARARR